MLPVLLLACGDNAATEPTIDAPPDSPPACSIAPTIARAQLVDASIAYLRGAFGITEPVLFTGGEVAYGEMWVSLNDGGCPLADWSTLAYVVDVDPVHVPGELRATHTRVAALWALNGRRFVAFLPDASTTGAAPWQEGRLPDSVVAVAKQGATRAAIDALIAQLATEAPAIRVQFLDAIGILTLETTIGNFAFDDAPIGRVPDIESAIERVRQSGLFDAPEWSGFVFRIPHESYPAARVDDDVLAPECLRTRTRQLRDDDMFGTLPSLATPLGPGETPNPAACQ